MSERTFSIIKPDAVKAGKAGEILARIEKAGFRIVALRLRHLTPRARPRASTTSTRRGPFFGSLCDFMSSGPCITHGARARRTRSRGCARSWARPIRPRPPPGTIRKDFAASIEANAIHGSDAPETAALRDRLLLPGHRARQRPGDSCLTARRLGLQEGGAARRPRRHSIRSRLDWLVADSSMSVTVWQC